MSKTTIDDIGKHAEILAGARRALGTLVQALQDGIEHMKAQHMPAIRDSIESAAVAWRELELMIERNPECFERPRTVQMHGIKFGLAKGRGGLDIEDPDRTIALIRKHLPDQADVLIATKETPVKDALLQLPASDLKRIGVNVRDTGDQVLIRPADGEVDKLVRTLVSGAVEKAGE
jgi:hypothetical protein